MAVKDFAPGIAQFSGYEKHWLGKDIVAGLVLSALLVPQGMAYAELAGLPAVTGLYTSILCLVGYAIFGPSRILVLGPDSSLGPMIAAVIIPLAGSGGDPARAIALASMLALMTGAIMIAAGALRLGFVADLLSKPTILGYMNGLALTIIVGQLPKLMGFSVDADGFIGELTGFVSGLTSGEVVPAAALVGISSLVLILVLNRVLPKIPAVLVAVILAMMATIVFGLGDLGVKLVGTLPQGLPSFTLPLVQWTDIPLLFAGAMGIALVALTDTISTATSFAERRGEEVDGDKEMIGIGAANVAAGLFQGFPVSTSGSRTAVAEQAGASPSSPDWWAPLVIAVMLLALPGPVRGSAAAVAGRRRHHRGPLPGRHPGHAAALPAATHRLRAVDRRVPRRGPAGRAARDRGRYRLSVANVFRRVWRPHQATLGRVPDLAGFHDTGSHPEAGLLGRGADLPVRRTADLRQRLHLPRRDPEAGQAG